ncbi:iron-containing alcohol dehydrogenase family protein [Thermovibrio sp.]
MPFERFFIPTRVVFGKGALKKLGEEVEFLGLNPQRTAVICSPSAVSNGYVKQIKEEIKGEVEVFSGVSQEPTVENAKEILEEVRKFSPSLIVAVGGGSPLDVAKAVSAMLTNEGRLEDYIGVPEAFKNPGVPLVAVPTTAGSGSEVTPYAVLTDRERMRKAPLISHRLFPALAIDDPTLTLSMPRSVAVNSGVDAFTHAVESLLSKRAKTTSKLYSLKSAELVFKFLPRSAGNLADLKAKEEVMRGSLLGGMAISLAGAGLVHTLAHILGVLKRVPHGLANGVFLVPVLRLYGLSAKEEIEELGRAIGTGGDYQKVIEEIENWLKFLGIPQSLKELGVEKGDIPFFVEKCTEKRFLMGNLPKIPSEREVRELLQTLV